MLRFSLRLVRPYWTWLVLVLGAMLLETAMSLASPWPLKIVLDSVIDSRPMPAWLAWMVGGAADRLALLNVAVGGTGGGDPTAHTKFPLRMLVDYVRATA